MLKKFLKGCLDFMHAVIEKIEFCLTDEQNPTLIVYAHPDRKYANRCPVCGKKCSVHSVDSNYRSCRSTNLGMWKVFIRFKTVRVRCPEHGVHTVLVPWAFKSSKFTKNFELLAAHLAAISSKLDAANELGCDWHTVDRCVKDIQQLLGKKFNLSEQKLVRIGIDETSYKKGHRYIMTIVDLDTNLIIWTAVGHDAETLSSFFESLSEEQRQSIQEVAGDGAGWIDTCVEKYVPQAKRSIDKFHYVSWILDALDETRRANIRQLNAQIRKIQKQSESDQTSLPDLNNKKKEMAELRQQVRNLKNAKTALGKNPENLTIKQRDLVDKVLSATPELKVAYELKEQARRIVWSESPDEAYKELQDFYKDAEKSGIGEFVELSKKIQRHEKQVLITIETELTSAAVEGFNNKIELIIRQAYGYRNTDNLNEMILLICNYMKRPFWQTKAYEAIMA